MLLALRPPCWVPFTYWTPFKLHPPMVSCHWALSVGFRRARLADSLPARVFADALQRCSGRDIHHCIPLLVCSSCRGAAGETYIIAGPEASMLSTFQLCEKITGIKAPTTQLSPALLKSMATLLTPLSYMVSLPFSMAVCGAQNMIISSFTV